MNIINQIHKAKNQVGSALTRFLMLLVLFVVGFLFALAASAINPVSHFTYRMIQNGTSVCISNSTALSMSSSNFVYYNYELGTNVCGGAIPFTIYTNFPTVGVNQTNFLAPIPSPITIGPLWSDLNGDVNPNIALQVIIGYTNIVIPSVGGRQTPTLLNTVWTNPTSFFTNPIAALAATNTITIQLVGIASMDMGPGFYDQGSTIPLTHVFQFTCIQSNATTIVVTTNLPTAFLQGMAAVYATVATTNSAGGGGQGIILNALNLVGWKPQ